LENKYHEFDNGVKIYSHHIIDVQNERYKECNVHEQEEESLFKEQLAEVGVNGCYVNIGAAVGYYSILTKILRDDIKVHAYEPLNMHRKYMKSNIRLNRITLKSIKIFSEAVSSESGILQLEKNNYSSFVHGASNGYSLVERIKGFFGNKLVRAVSLADVVTRAGGAVDLMQMDIQGHELSLLEKSREILGRHVVGCIIVGTHSSELHTGCADLLKSCGYRLIFDNFETVSQPDGILIARV
jgi:FkbM family methyltransferase